MNDQAQVPPANGDEGTEDFEAMLAKALGATSHDLIERAIEQTEPLDDLPDGHKSGYVAVVGQPNVGKSTLINQMLGEKIAIVSPKPQTTRIRQLGILSRPDLQAIFIDTPGIHKPQDELGHFMLDVVKAALHDADLVLFVVDISSAPNQRDQQVIGYLRDLPPEKIILVMNKVDLANNPDKFRAAFETYENMLPKVEHLGLAAVDGYKVADLVDKIVERLPEGPRYYPTDQVSDVPMRGIAAEMIREQALRFTQQEIPHSIAVEVDEFKRRNDQLIYIHASIYTERDGQKAILIGKDGNMLKKIGAAARSEIESFVGSKVYLELKVKVLNNWRKDPKALQRFGYRL